MRAIHGGFTEDFMKLVGPRVQKQQLTLSP